MEEKLPYPTRLIHLPDGTILEEFIIPEDDKEYVLKELYPFEPIPDLDTRLLDLHAEKEFIVREFRVFWEDGMNWLTSPYYVESGGTVIDWWDEANAYEIEDLEELDLPAPMKFPTEPWTDFEYNPDYVRRDKLLGIDSQLWEDEFNQIVRFDGLTLPALESLLAERFINPKSAQNLSPTTEQFLAFMRRHPQAVAHGYAVSPYRDDYRISIEGLFVKQADATWDIRHAFEELCREADEYEDGGNLYSWWD